MIQVSFFNPPINNLTPNQTMLLTALFEMIRTDKGYKEKINRLRALKKKVERDAFKKSELGGVTLCGTFLFRADKSISTHNGIIGVDIDGLTEDEMLITKKDLKDLHNDIVGYFISPSGNGYKVLLRVDHTKFSNKDNYLAAVLFLQANIGIDPTHFDLSCSNLSRLTFISYDENAYLNETILLNNTAENISLIDTANWLPTNEETQVNQRQKHSCSNIFESPYQGNSKLDFYKKGEKLNFHILLQIATKSKGGYTGGNRHNFIQYLSSIANQFGMPENYFIRYCTEYFENHLQSLLKNDIFDIDNSLLPLIKDTYSRYSNQFGTWVETEVAEELETPCFPDELYENLPMLLKKPAILFKEKRDKDVFLIGLIGVFSSWIPKVQGIYDCKLLGANLFVVVSAPASAGKGTLHWSRRVTKNISQTLKEKYVAALQEYEATMAEYEAAKKNGEEAIKPVKPRKQKFIIAGNVSSAAMIGCIEANKHFGLIFETEADTLSNTLSNNEWGNWTDILRKCFQHEPVSILRKKDNEDLEIERPHLSMVLSGTPSQITRLVSQIENGFFSRLLYYDFPNRDVWKNVFEKQQTNFEVYFDAYASRMERLLAPYFFNKADDNSDIVFFEFTPNQEKLFNDWFSEKQTQLNHIYGDEIIASVRRLAICFFRVAMMLSVMRHIETHKENEASYTKAEKIVCIDVDYNNAELIINTLLFHTIKIFNQVKKVKRNKFSKGKRDLLLEKLPSEFNRSVIMDLASFIGIKEKTAENYITSFIQQNSITRLEHNSYKKLI